MSAPRSLDEILKNEGELIVEKALSLENAFQSNDVATILRAQQYLVQQRGKQDEGQAKSLFMDPMDLTSSFGYKDKPYNLSYEMLRAMGKTHIIKAVKNTRKAQVISFCEPQRTKATPGFTITKRNKWRATEKDRELSSEDQKKADYITEFLLNCGRPTKQEGPIYGRWGGNTFDTFVGMLLDDSLTLDQGTFEIIRDRRNRPTQFLATDGATYRVADQFSYTDEQRKEAEMFGYVPSHVQLYQGKIVADFYPWELGWCIRNPTTDIRTNGYGKAELEDLIQTVTSLLNSDSYNANFFRVGSSPKGILKYSGAINQNTIDDFRKQWIAQLTGPQNMHKLPIINADKMDFINTHVANKDMEFSKFQEFLIKVSCAIFLIDPSEINFPMAGESDHHHMFEGSPAARLQFSKDKGLKPLLKWLQYWINQYIVWQIDPTFEFRFGGIDDQDEEDSELENDIKRLGNFMTINEIRVKNNLTPIDGGDIIANPMFMQAMQMNQMGDEQTNAAVADDENGAAGEEENPNEENPFMKALQSEIGKLLS